MFQIGKFIVALARFVDRSFLSYIRYCGTMNLGGIHYNETSTFASKSSADEYRAKVNHDFGP